MFWKFGMLQGGTRSGNSGEATGLEAEPVFIHFSFMSDKVAMHKALLKAVGERLDLVADHAWRDRDPAGHLEGLKAAAGRLDMLVANLPADADPMLRHYLERQSYTKARDWLEQALG